MTHTFDQATSSGVSSLEVEGRVLRNSGWVALSLGARQLASLLTMFVLARLLEPEDFGLVALAWSVLFFADQIQETGIGSALIHRRHDIERAAASALIYTPLFSLLLYAVVFAFAPLFTRLLDAPGFTNVLRVMAVVLLLRGIRVVPSSILERDLKFRSRMICETAATFAQVCLSVVLALAGLGVWSLVAGYVVSAAVEAAAYWLLVPWRPAPRLASRQVLLELIRYGRFVGAASILVIVANTAHNVTISRALGASSVGLFAIAFRLAEFPNSVIGHILGRPMFSVYSSLQHDPAAFRHAYVRNLQRVALLSLPVSVSLVIVAEPIVAALLGEKWMSTVPVLRILAIFALIKPFGGVAAEALKGLGKPQWNFGFGVLFLAVEIPALVILTPAMGIAGAAVAMLASGVVTTVPAVTITSRELGLSLRNLTAHLAPSVFCSGLLAVALVALLASSGELRPAAALAVLAAGGLLVYATATALFARSVVLPMWHSLRSDGH